MTEQQHARALQIKERLAHIDGLIDFLRELTSNPGGMNNTKAWLEETGFIPHPKGYRIDQADVDCLREALAREKLLLEQEFNRL
jgi:hypothetical protein